MMCSLLPIYGYLSVMALPKRKKWVKEVCQQLNTGLSTSTYGL